VVARMFVLILACSSAFSVAGVVAGDSIAYGAIKGELSVDDDARVYKPVDVAWDTAGLAYLLCEGSCSVLVVDNNFEVVREIGRCGDGPGELENAATVEIAGERLFVFQGHRVDVFALSGAFLTREVLGKQVDDTTVVDGRVIGTTKDGKNQLLYFDAGGNAIVEFGPTCDADEWDERYLKCGTMTLLNDDNQIILLDPVLATVRWSEGDEWVDRSLGLNSGGTWREGSAVHKSFAINTACAAPGKNRLLMLYMERRDDKHVALGVVNNDWKIVKIGETTESIRKIAISPAGDLWLLLWSSEVKVYDNLAIPCASSALGR